MTVLSGQSILRRRILEPCCERTAENGYSFGLGPAGYDLRLDLGQVGVEGKFLEPGEFLLAATLERFTMPPDLLGIVHDKSTWARRGLTVQNTVIEPGWRGYLTLELHNHGPDILQLPQGVGIAQVIFHMLDEPAQNPYDGKYQDQEAGPQHAR